MKTPLKLAIENFDEIKHDIAAIAYVIIKNDGNMLTFSATSNQTRLTVIAGIEILKFKLLEEFDRVQNEMNVSGMNRQ